MYDSAAGGLAVSPKTSAVLASIGNTPLIDLSDLAPPGSARLLHRIKPGRGVWDVCRTLQKHA